MQATSGYTKIHLILISAGFLTAALIRFLGLGIPAISENEAVLAVQSWHTAHGQATLLSGQPLYLILTTVIFYLFGSSDFLARLVPSLAGLAIVIAPVMLKDQIKPRLLIILIWLLALEPALIAASRQAESPIIAICMILWLIVWIIRKQWILSGVFLGLSILSGQSIWFFLVGLILSLLIWVWISRVNLGELLPTLFASEADDRKKIIYSALITVLGFGSFFMIIPSGLSSIGSSFIAWLDRFTGTSAIPVWMPLTAILLYCPLVLLFGISGGIRSLVARSKAGLLLIMAVMSLILAVLLPERSISDLVFTTVPLCIIAAIEIDRYLVSEPIDVMPSLGIMALVLVILLFLGQVFSRLALGNLDNTTFFLTAGGGLFILIISAILAIFGWSYVVAGQGYRWALMITLCLITLISAWRASPSYRSAQFEFWDTGQIVPEDRLLVDTIHEVSTWSRGTPTALKVTVIGNEDARLSWYLRNQNSLVYDLAFSAENSPEAVITTDAIDPTLIQQYRGQDFVFTRRIAWELFSPIDWLNWLSRRFVPLPEDSYHYLWIRTDLFPGGSNSFSGLKQP